MTRDQEQLASEFIEKIAREVVPVDGGKHNGYHLRRPNGTKFGFVRYNIGGSNPGKYRVYVNGFLDDPLGIFGQSSGSTLVAPDDGDAVRYVIRVLESCYDNAR